MANQVITFCFLLNNLNYNIPNNDLNGNILTLLNVIQLSNNNTASFLEYSSLYRGLYDQKIVLLHRVYSDRNEIHMHLLHGGNNWDSLQRKKPSSFSNREIGT
jgi:hypothetical protein